MSSKKKRGGWFRSYEEMGDDPKFRVIAKRASSSVPGVRASDAIAVWTQLLCRASKADDRGSIEGYDCESADLHFDMPEGAACAIMEAFAGKGMIHEGRIVKWEDRQPKREDDSSERTKKWRGHCDASERDVTHCDASERDVTLEQNRTEQNTHEEEACARDERKPPKLDRPSKASRPDDWKGFAAIWAVYPVKQEQEAAWNEFCRLKDNGTLAPPGIIRDRIVDLTSNDSRWQRGIGIPSLAKWLAGKRWNDEPYVEQDASTGPVADKPRVYSDEEVAAMMARRQA